MTIETAEKNTVLFIQLVSMFHTAAMQHLGKIKNPMSDKIERSLEQAQFAIDILDMIQTKTSGSITPDENRFLSSVLQELKLNYVDEMEKDRQQQTHTEEKQQ